MELEIEPTPDAVKFGYMKLRGTRVNDLGDYIVWILGYQYSIFFGDNPHRLSQKPGFRRAQVKRNLFKRIWIMRELK